MTADRSDERALAESADRAGRWSKTDLRQRLEHLPPGHPSSLRSDDPDSGRPRRSPDVGVHSAEEKTDEDLLGRRGTNTPDDSRNATRDGNEKRAVPEGTGRDPDTRPAGDLEGPDLQVDTAKQNYWSEVPRFLRAWADHVRRWPVERSAVAVDRSRDPAGSWRGDGNQYLDPEQHARTEDVIVRVRQTEESVTKHMRETERDNACDGWLEGLEFRRKGDERLKEKIAESLRIAPVKEPEEIIREIPDAIRYTFCFESSNYAGGYSDVKDRMQSNGYRMIYSKNHWSDDPEYKGTNTRWLTPEGQLFEVQFHTPESYHAKQEVTHKSYERIRNPLTGRTERRELEAFQRDVCSWITVPSGIASIPDYEERE